MSVSFFRLAVDRSGTLEEQLARIGLSNAPHPFWGGVWYMDRIPRYDGPDGADFGLLPSGSRTGFQLQQDFSQDSEHRPADITELITYLQHVKTLSSGQEIHAFGSVVADEEGVLRVPCARVNGRADGLNIEFQKITEYFRGECLVMRR